MHAVNDRFLIYAPVQTDKTAESIAEALREVSEFRSANPVTDTELQRAVANQTLQLAGQWETIGAVQGSVSEIVRFGLPDDYWENYSDSIFELSKDRLKLLHLRSSNPII